LTPLADTAKLNWRTRSYSNRYCRYVHGWILNAEEFGTEMGSAMGVLQHGAEQEVSSAIQPAASKSMRATLRSIGAQHRSNGSPMIRLRRISSVR